MENSEYYIHDNGGCPFMVTFNSKTAIVKRLDGYNDVDSENYYSDKTWSQILEFTDYKKILSEKTFDQMEYGR